MLKGSFACRSCSWDATQRSCPVGPGTWAREGEEGPMISILKSFFCTWMRMFVIYCIDTPWWNNIIQYNYNRLVWNCLGIVCVHRESVHAVNTCALLTSHPVLDKSGLAEAWLWSFDAATPAALRIAKIKHVGVVHPILGVWQGWWAHSPG